MSKCKTVQDEMKIGQLTLKKQVDGAVKKVSLSVSPTDAKTAPAVATQVAAAKRAPVM